MNPCMSIYMLFSKYKSQVFSGKFHNQSVAYKVIKIEKVNFYLKVNHSKKKNGTPMKNLLYTKNVHLRRLLDKHICILVYPLPLKDFTKTEWKN